MNFIIQNSSTPTVEVAYSGVIMMLTSWWHCGSTKLFIYQLIQLINIMKFIIIIVL